MLLTKESESSLCWQLPQLLWSGCRAPCGSSPGHIMTSCWPWRGVLLGVVEWNVGHDVGCCQELVWLVGPDVGCHQELVWLVGHDVGCHQELVWQVGHDVGCHQELVWQVGHGVGATRNWCEMLAMTWEPPGIGVTCWPWRGSHQELICRVGHDVELRKSPQGFLSHVSRDTDGAN